jgi:hypothetical protein
MINKIEQTEIDSRKVSNIPTRPNSTGLYGDKPLSSKDLKERVDALSLLAISKLNEIIEGMAAGGEVAKTMKFKHGDNEYSLSELFSMIFKPENGLSDVLKTSYGESLTLNSALANIMSAMQTEYATSLSASFDDTETYMLCIRLLNKNGEDLLNDFKIDMRVNSDRIIDKSVTTSKLADESVTEAKLNSNVSDKLNSAFKQVKYDASNGHLTFTDSNGVNVTIDLPLELIVNSGEYDDTENEEAIVLTLANGEKIRIPVNDLIDTIDNRFGDVEDALDTIIAEQEAIIAMQNQLIGGDGKWI